MKTKEFKETVIKSASLTSDDIKYTYTLSVNISNKVASFRLPLYSIEVKMLMPDGKETRASAENAFADIGKALVFYDKALRNLVTPIDLAYVLEDERH